MNQKYFDEYYDFYDFTKENEEIMKKLEAKYANSKTGGVEFDFAVTLADDDEEWVDIDSNISDGNGENQDMRESKEKYRDSSEAKKKRKVYKLRRAQLLDTDELLLPSGKIAGHKKFIGLYKQRPIIGEGQGYRMLENGRKVYSGNSTYTTAVAMCQMNKEGGQLLQSDMNKYIAKQNHSINKKLLKYRRREDLKRIKISQSNNKTGRQY